MAEEGVHGRKLPGGSQGQTDGDYLCPWSARLIGGYFRRRRMTTSTEAISAPSGAFGSCVITS